MAPNVKPEDSVCIIILHKSELNTCLEVSTIVVNHLLVWSDATLILPKDWQCVSASCISTIRSRWFLFTKFFLIRSQLWHSKSLPIRIWLNHRKKKDISCDSILTTTFSWGFLVWTWRIPGGELPSPSMPPTTVESMKVVYNTRNFTNGSQRWWAGEGGNCYPSCFTSYPRGFGNCNPCTAFLSRQQQKKSNIVGQVDSL